MDDFLKPINIKALKGNIFGMLDDDWMLITAGNKENFNTMTASWGAFGILWNKPIAICFVRPQRYTYGFLNANDYFTLSFFSKEHHKILEFCGAHSGKNTDKIAQTGLVPLTTPKGNIYFDHTLLVLECKKLYVDDLNANNFLDQKLIQNIYPSSDFHRLFIGEITLCLANDKLIVEKGLHFDAPNEDNNINF